MISNMLNIAVRKFNHSLLCYEYKKYKQDRVDKELFIKGILEYVESLKLSDGTYSFSKSCRESSIYSQTYAALILSMYKEINDKEYWIDYFNSVQVDEGYFFDGKYDQKFYTNGGGWGMMHLVPHIIIAYDRLEAIPKKEFSFLDKYKNPDNMIKFLESLDYNNVWASSNDIMNVGISMQYARDRMFADYGDAIETMEIWLLNKLNPKTGMWKDGDINSRRAIDEMIRGFYHILPIFYYDKIDIPHGEIAIDYILKSQNKYGGFDKSIGSSACADIDGLDPLLRLCYTYNIRNEQIESAIQNAKKWISFNQNQDGGFVFERKCAFKYGNQNNLSSKKDESNLFATWFRSVSLELIDSFLQNENTVFINSPGYECPIIK